MGKSNDNAKSKSSLMMWATIGKLMFWLILFCVFTYLIYTITAPALSAFAWLYNLDSTMILVLIMVIGLFTTFLFMSVVNRGRGSKK